MKAKESESSRPKVSFTAPRRFRAALRIVVCVLMSAALVSVQPLHAQAGASDVGGKREVTVMTYNVYVGALIDRILLLDPTDPEFPTRLVETVTQIYWEVVASDPPARMEAIADEIAARRPDLVSLQELTTVLTQSPGDSWVSPAEDVVYDYLQLLLDALAERGVPYTAAAVATEFDVELPMMGSEGLEDARIIDHEAILVRSDPPPGHLRASNPQSGHFQYIIEVPDLGIYVDRGWCSVDVFVRGRQFRYVCAHPEPSETLPELNHAQIAELLGEMSNVNLPVLLTGDYNTDPLQRDGSYSYALFGEAGYSDAWNGAHRDDLEGGLTYGHDYYLTDPSQEFTWRLDLVLSRGDLFTPATFEVIDPTVAGPTPPLWPSDHAGIYAELLIH